MSVTILFRSLLILTATEALRSQGVRGVEKYGGWLARSPMASLSASAVLLPLVSFLIHFTSTILSNSL